MNNFSRLIDAASKLPHTQAIHSYQRIGILQAIDSFTYYRQQALEKRGLPQTPLGSRYWAKLARVEWEKIRTWLFA